MTAFWKSYGRGFFNYRDWFNYFFYIPVLLLTVLSFMINWIRGFIVLAGFFISIPVTIFLLYLLYGLPFFWLSYRLGNIPRKIDRLFEPLDNYKIYNRDKINAIKEKIKKKKFPNNDLLAIWLYRLKCHKQHLTTNIPPILVVLSLCILNLLNLFGIDADNIIKSIVNTQSLFSFMVKIFPITWLLLVPYREIQETSERIFKIELLKDLKK